MDLSRYRPKTIIWPLSYFYIILSSLWLDIAISTLSPIPLSVGHQCTATEFSQFINLLHLALCLLVIIIQVLKYKVNSLYAITTMYYSNNSNVIQYAGEVLYNHVSVCFYSQVAGWTVSDRFNRVILYFSRSFHAMTLSIFCSISCGTF